MKKIALITGLICLLISACGGRQTKSEATEQSGSDYLFTIPSADGLCLYGIQDGPQTMSAELFKGFDNALLDSLLPEGQAEAGFNVFLLQQEGHVVLFDAGLGAAKGGRLLEALDSLGVAREQVTDICLTHLHFDHVGGLFAPDSTAMFPAAILHIPQPEYEACASGLLGNADLASLLTRSYGERVHLFSPGDTLVEGVCSIAAPGHTPGHTIYDLGGVLIAGDIMHAVSLQLEHPEFCARFDADPAQAVITRRAVLDRARKEHLTLCGMHFPKPLAIQF